MVSVITPSFNQGRFLEETLRTVATQDYPSIEHIILDGGSTDESVAILRSWDEKHTIRWLSEPDRGQAEAIQRGIGMSTGDIVTWLNSDDFYLHSTVISSAVAAFSRGASVVTAGGWYVSENGQRTRKIPVRPSRLSHAKLKCVDWVLQPATFVERRLLLDYPLDTKLSYAFDWDLFIRLSEDASFTTVEAEWSAYRVHRDGKTVTGGASRRNELLHVVRRYQGGSLRYVALRLLSIACDWIESLPPVPRRPVTRLVRLAVHLSNELTDGRGSPFRARKDLTLRPYLHRFCRTDRDDGRLVSG